MDYNDARQVWDYLEEYRMFTYEELRLVTGINGYSVRTLNEMIYSRYGYSNLKEYLETEFGDKI